MLKKKTTVYTIFSAYTIDKQISQGGNGTIFLAHDSNNEKYALKAIDRGKTSNEKLKRFKNELLFCENNTHPHIIKVLDHGTYTEEGKNIVFYIMPLYEHTLRDLMTEGIAPDRILTIITQILSGLSFAHKKSVWHRDIKPENILIDERGNAVIADFGIAHFSRETLATIIETKQSDRMANFQYAAPEQRIRGGEVDGHADIYAVGLILNEMFTHTLPIGTDYIKIGQVNSEYAWLDPVVNLMLQQSPGERPYPASTVATRILAAQKEWRESQELLSLAEEKPDNDGPYQMEVPVIRYFEYDEGELKVYLDGVDYDWFEDWFSILQAGRYDHAETMGFGTNRLKKYPPDCIAIHISAESKNYLKSIAKNIKDWLNGATKVFNTNQRDQYNREELARQQRVKAEIERLKNEAEMREAVKGLFD